MQEETNIPKKDEEMTGSDAPHGDGTVSDEDVHKINEGGGAPPAGGQDHSTENYGESMPDEGVGGVQDSDQPSASIAHIEE